MARYGCSSVNSSEGRGGCCMRKGRKDRGGWRPGSHDKYHGRKERRKDTGIEGRMCRGWVCRHRDDRKEEKEIRNIGHWWSRHKGRHDLALTGGCMVT